MMDYIINLILGAVIGTIAGLSVYFFTLKKGKEKERQKSMDNSVKDTIEIKKDEEKRRNDPIAVIRDRLRKYTRD